MIRTAQHIGQWIRESTRYAIYHRDGFRCAYCGAVAEDGARLTLDHVHARELGGSNDSANLVTACMSCNSAKRALTMRGWLAYLRSARGLDVAATRSIASRVRRACARTLNRNEGRRLVALRRAA